MAKGKGRKRKPGVKYDGESSSQTQDSCQEPLELPEKAHTRTRYVPKFGNFSKRTRTDSVNKACMAQESKMEDISYTQPPESVAKESFTNESVSATQPIPEQHPPQMGSQSYLDVMDSAQSSHSTIPGLSLTQVDITPQAHTPPTSVDCKEEHINSPKENMNLELLNPFNNTPESISAENTSPKSIIDPVPGTDKSQDSYDTNEQTKLSGPLVTQPNEDATLPNSQDLPDNIATTDTLYNDSQETLQTKVEDNPGSDYCERDVAYCVDGEGVVCEGEEDKVIKEIMGLRAEDLVESQFTADIAVVPSVESVSVPLTTGGAQRTASQTHKRTGYTFNQLDSATAHTVAGQGVLKGLVRELSSINAPILKQFNHSVHKPSTPVLRNTSNQYILRCKRELEAARKKRDTWLRTRPPTHHR